MAVAPSPPVVLEHDRPPGDADLAAVGALLAERARAKVLLALLDGRALPASVLASEAGVAPSTASHHLGRLVDAGWITVVARGRHRYYGLSGARVAELLEAVARVAPAERVTSLREGSRAHALRYARSCYDHVAGRVGVAISDALQERQVLTRGDGGDYVVTDAGARMLLQVGIRARPGEVARACIDWTEQRSHVAGPLGRALLHRILERGWVVRDARTRALRITDAGSVELPTRLGVRLP